MAKSGQISGHISLLFILLSLFSFSVCIVLSETDTELISALVSLRDRSPSGVIHLDDHSLRRFLNPSSSRPFSIFLFFDALQLHDRSELHLPDLKQEFKLVSAAFARHHKGKPSETKVFFCTIEFKESQSTFGLFGVNSLPHVRYIGPNENPKTSEAMDQSEFARMSDGMAAFVHSKTRLEVGHIDRPPMVSKKQIMFLCLVFLLSAPFAIKKVLAGETPLHEPKVWLGFAVFVYFFSVSGAMHNIIRKMPMFIADRNDPSKLVFFYHGSGMQLGAEGFAVGFLYTIVGLMLAFVTHLLVYVKNKSVQKGFMFVAILVSFWAVKKVIYLDNWKTGYGVHAFWPSGW
ncbi:hypothetical protein AMTRI_Chr02g259860 [Amborella trichopoda]|uniref:Dolichyl-diphosphooligosaccharide--protein glycosyltransferase subunit 3B n=1 Tax=Amborella trichopoda TaxID=13333 RepID=W1NRY2_AMBTC|nr:probable dolichyl-diphosphooligosaccharide--protein glycosyltransferase subunit 3B [Amborella trichopoda]ERM97499.1 hypothetical protein AMTR_s00125p00122100 [Amborella trichopoda]|eukprot:XP_006830083.1 probable dolichyl-diphosphooligosaccharide--protein glycosyltransferase subunit 3B [Amborella trichopoda]